MAKLILFFILFLCFYSSCSSPKPKKKALKLRALTETKTNTKNLIKKTIKNSTFQNIKPLMNNILDKEVKITKIPFNKHLNTVYFVATGDIIPHGAVKKTGKLNKDGSFKKVPDFGDMFKGVKPLIKESDIAFANFETPYKPDTMENIYKSIPYKFNIPIKMIDSLKSLGFTIFSIANNHLYDQGVKGLSSTIDMMKKYQFLHIGAGKNYQDAIKPVIIEKKGMKIGFVAFTTWINNDKNKYTPFDKNSSNINKNKPYINRYHKKVAIETIRKLRKKVDFLVVSTHWGHEYHENPSFEQKLKVKTFIKAGADLILGHHPHVLQPLEYNNGVYVIYSMGNFISNQFFDVRSKHSRHKKSNREGIVYRFELFRNDENKVAIKRIKYKPIYIYKDKFKSKLAKAKYRILLKQPKESSKEYKKIVEFIGPTTINTEKMKKISKQIIKKLVLLVK